eukprot:10648838-Alexandrium_andersonii.AAC.1
MLQVAVRGVPAEGACPGLGPLVVSGVGRCWLSLGHALLRPPGLVEPGGARPGPSPRPPASRRQQAPGPSPAHAPPSSGLLGPSALAASGPAPPR